MTRVFGLLCYPAALLLLTAGCATTNHSAGGAPAGSIAKDDARDLHQARIEYVVGAGPASAGVRQASHTPAGASVRHTVTNIEYPHPSGDKDKALATLVVLREPSEAAASSRGHLASFGAWASRMLPGITVDDRVASAKGLSLSKSELDQLLRDVLTADDTTLSRRSDARLVLEVNDLSLGNHSASHPALEELSRRIAEEGQVLAADHPHVEPLLAEANPTSESFYRSLREMAE